MAFPFRRVARGTRLAALIAGYTLVSVSLRLACGPFLIPHRHQRTLRRHILFFDFLHRAVLAPESWAEIPRDAKEKLKRRALELWHEK